MTETSATSEFVEAQVTKMLDRSPWNRRLHTWVSIGSGNKLAVRFNWVTFLLASIVIWAFAAVALANPSSAETEFKAGKAWVSQNFTWLYIITQDVWCAFLIYLAFSRFSDIKLGRDDEKPRYNDFTWFCMLFTCGVAVGLYVYGVSEPLYFYRQPTLWHSWSYDYAITKVGVENDAQRANQAIFQAIYHWGIHGWVPYILLALLVGTVSFRWNMPMTIRSCFYPLFGDHALGFLGDFVDSFSIATTTFGVCTSLGLGVGQLADGLKFVKNVGCDVKTNCVAMGGVWDLNTYGANSCRGFPAAMSSCDASWLAGSESKNTAMYVIIVCITVLACCSVLTGLDRGIKTLSQIAFTLGMVVCLTVMMADNTWYILNVQVQSLGYYLQYVIQVGFDCEAYQQLGFEFVADGGSTGNRYWGSTGANSALGKIAAAGLSVSMSQDDCGLKLNPCNMGFIRASILEALGNSYAPLAASAAAMLSSYGLNTAQQGFATAAYANFKAAYGGAGGIPCGSGWNATNMDPFLVNGLTGNMGAGANPSDQPHCAGMAGAALTACTAAWSGTFPRCPETRFSEVGQWGWCDKFFMKCNKAEVYFGDTNRMFMDWWTIFYWAWWITWAPFVGFFVALISRGRTVREVIIGGFVCPTLFAIFWFGVFGSLAFKMQRTAEIALSVKPDIGFAMTTCAEHYEFGPGTPITPESKKLADQGYYLLSCFYRDTQIYHLMEPYKNLTGFLHIFLWFGLVIYFLTSSDSGSMTDDIISASGLSSKHIPLWQKVYWCSVEGVVAIALVSTGSEKALQAVSIVIGLPYTFVLCMMVPALYRVCKKCKGDEDIAKSYRFNTQLLDFLVAYQPDGGSPCKPMEHFTAFLLALVCPFLHLKAALSKCYPNDKCSPIAFAGAAYALYITFITCHIVEVATPGVHTIAWLAFLGFAAILTFTRVMTRQLYNVWGSYIDDLSSAIFLWPWALAQLKMAAETDNKDAPTYWQSADEMIAQLAEVAPGGAVPDKKGSFEASTV